MATCSEGNGGPSDGPVFVGGEDRGPSHLQIRQPNGRVEAVLPRREPTWRYDEDDPDRAP